MPDYGSPRDPRQKTQYGNRDIGVSGRLADVLMQHALERCYRFFWMLFTLQILIDRIAEHMNERITSDMILLRYATHQHGSGRTTQVQSPKYHHHMSTFDKYDPDCVLQPASQFTELDAAHTCNLGISADFLARVKMIPETNIHTLVHTVETLAANTILLPRGINIGPDRIIDEMQNDYAHEILTFMGSQSALSLEDIRYPPTESLLNDETMSGYLTRACTRMLQYKKEKENVREFGYVSAITCYLIAYIYCTRSFFGMFNHDGRVPDQQLFMSVPIPPFFANAPPREPTTMNIRQEIQMTCLQLWPNLMNRSSRYVSTP